MTSSSVTIRPFRPDHDYPALCAVWNAAWPDYPETPDELRFFDAKRDPKVKHARWVAETAGGQAVGIGEHTQRSGMYHPRRFHVEVTVSPEHEGRGVGGALYEAVVDALQAFDPLALRSEAREDKARGVRFLQDRGFVEDQREHESRLDLAAFDPARWEAELERATQAGVVLRTTRELRDADGDFYRKMDDLCWEVGQDVPHTEAMTRTPHEVWVKRFENPRFLWDGNVVALDPNGEYIGVSELEGSETGKDLYTGLTGVRRAYRGKGIATALKVRALSYATQLGAEGLRTWNEVNNAGMLGINGRLGFVRQPAWLQMVKVIKIEEAVEEEA